MSQIRKVAGIVSICAILAGPVLAGEGPVPSGIPNLDHVFLIMMENHGYEQIVGNPNAPFTNKYMRPANAADELLRRRPSQPDQLSRSRRRIELRRAERQLPDWHNASCTTNLASGTASTDTPTSPPVCPIRGSGTDAATPAFDTTNEVTPPAVTSVTNIDGVQSIPAAPTPSARPSPTSSRRGA